MLTRRAVDEKSLVGQDSQFGICLNGLQRREWLRRFAGVCGFVVVDIAFGAAMDGCRNAGVESLLWRWSAALPGDVATLRQLGKSYLAAHPQEAVEARLSRLLLPDDRSEIVASALSKSVSRDWASYNVAVVNGWVLARTEARLCAMMFLTGASKA